MRDPGPLAVCGNCEFRYPCRKASDKDRHPYHCAQGHDDTAQFAGNGNDCPNWVFINDGAIRRKENE